ncbi:MAG: hypothetical protein JWQ71_1530 [Pedosphaera sp.]|nr:hypothetical protein [Pedosphaera sp.]
MGDHVYVRFKLKKVRVDSSFLSELDACFAAVEYHHSLTLKGGKGYSLHDRHKALERAPTDEGAWRVSFGYSATGLDDNTEIHVIAVFSEDEETIDSLQMETHTVSYYFRPDVEIDGSEELRQRTRIAKMVRQVIPLMHKRFKALRTEAWAGYGDKPFIVLD